MASGLPIPAAAAAVVLLATWIGWKLLERPLQIDVEQLADSDLGKTFNPRPEVVEDFFRAEGIQTMAPADAKNPDVFKLAPGQF